MSNGLPYAHGSATSREAAEDARPTSRGCAFRIFQFILEQGARGATRDEVFQHFRNQSSPISYQTATARYRALEYSTLVVSNGERRRTTSGSSAEVCVAKVAADFNALYREPPPGAKGTVAEEAVLQVCREEAAALFEPETHEKASQRILNAVAEHFGSRPNEIGSLASDDIEGFNI